MRRGFATSLSAFAFLIPWPAAAQPVVDGTRDGVYDDYVAVQTVETGFGDNFNELDAAYGVCGATRLYLMLTGNIEDNFNKIEVFIDSKPGGQAFFDSSGNDGAGAMDGLAFDDHFRADYHLIFRRGIEMANPKVNLDFANLVAQSASGYFDIMTGGGLEGTGSTGTGVNAVAILVGYDDSNAAGVLGGGSAAANAAAAAAVTTGLELGIALSDLGYDGTHPIQVMAGVNNSNHNFWSNQFLGGLAAPQGNLGGDGTGIFTGEGAIDFTLFAGRQFFIACSLLFRDGFESNSTGEWSSTGP